ncbi:branched-chain amino acid ABC transporter permease [Halostagnicola kamekurae]|uniref:Branched-chain amino acid transport system permease protein n=1 Tax=Halostagnicola kamekurae TaxID=619731 RepID=A0A1I6TNH1_9EURY|nr:branched-chain amino acid ABC transporter permease [Halostagnicola kamekurae]SFS90782.1 branched-chain amino acid transport system permease protein [Halostagnicola kamekurae]
MKAVTQFFERSSPASTGNHLLSSRGRLALVVAIAVLAVAAPIVEQIHPFWLNILVRMLIYALFALSLDFVFGYAGLLSFGHAAMFGAGGYAAAILLIDGTSHAFVVLPAAILTGVAVAALIGWLSVRARGIYFAMLTLAFAQMFYVIAFTDLPATVLGRESVTGGDNGLYGIGMYELFGIDFTSTLMYFYLTLALVALSLAVLVRLANSPFGRVLQGIRENEERIQFIGYDVRRYKIAGFAISGGFAGLAGGLFVPFQSVAHPGNLHWMVSGELIVMLLVGGMGTLWGPMLGAGLIVLLEEQLAGFASWEVILGSVFVAVVVFAPRGLAGILISLRNDPGGAIDNVKGAIRNYVEAVRG